MKPALYKSFALHAVIVLLFLVDLPLFWRQDMVLEQVPIIVDLEQVKISEMTNLPAKAEFGDEDKAATKAKITPPAPKPEPKPEPETKNEPSVIEAPKETPPPEDETPLPPKEDFMIPPQPSKPKLEDKKPEPKRPTPPPQPVKPKAAPRPKKPEPKKQDTKSKTPEVSALKNLLDSVNAMEQNLGQEDANAIIKKGTNVSNMGIEGGIGGSYFSELTISETDALASRLRQCWNLDPGAMGIEDMIVEIRATLNQDGTVRQVDVLDSGRYMRDAHFRSVADSAKRAVYVCAPYSLLTQKYGDKYDVWKTMLLKFNPVNHTVQ